jgi:hypothetical protein
LFVPEIKNEKLEAQNVSMNDILVLNNGVRFENYQYLSHHPLGIDESGIEYVEIIKDSVAKLVFIFNRNQ